MHAESKIDEERNVAPQRFSFGISTLLLVVTIAAISLAWWVDHNRSPPQQFDIPGPISVSYTVRTSPTSTSGQTIHGAKGINFQGNSIVVFSEIGGTVISQNSLIHFNWQPE